MLHVILLILKIILWIILGLLGLLVLLLLLILFAPVRYRADISYQGGKTMQAAVKVRYLVLSFCLQFDQTTGDMEQRLRVFGFELGKKAKKTPDNPSPEPQTELQTESYAEPQTEPQVESYVEPQAEPQEEPQKEQPEAATIKEKEADDDIPEIFDLEADIGDELPESEKKATGRLKAFFTGIREKLQQIRKLAEDNTADKLAEAIQSRVAPLKKKLRDLQRFWNLSCTVKTRNYLKKYIPGVIRHILPRRVRGYVHYGFEEPYKTGQVTGYLSLIPFVYQKHLSLQPDFHRKVLELQLDLKGRIRIGYLVRIVLNINLWRTLKAAKKIMNR